MASDGSVRLSRLLLQQSDRHPIRHLTDDLLADQDPEAIDGFVHRGLLVPTRMRSSEDLVVHRDNGGVDVATRPGSFEVESLGLDETRIFEIDFLALCRCLRNEIGLAGPPCDEIARGVVYLGAEGKRARRRQVYLIRMLTPRRAREALLAVRAHAEDEAILVLTPTQRELPRATTRQADDPPIASVTALLRAGGAPFAIRLPASPPSKRSSAGAIRLTVDVDGGVARLDGKDVRLQPRDFAALQLLAVEGHGLGGFVGRDQIGGALRAATGRDGNEEQIEKAISRIRSALCKVSPEAGRDLIETKPKVGYRLMLRTHEISVS